MSSVEVEKGKVVASIEALTGKIREAEGELKVAQKAGDGAAARLWLQQLTALQQKENLLLEKEARLQAAGIRSQHKSKRLRYDETAESGSIAKELVKKRKVETGDTGADVLNGWSILPQAKILRTQDLRLLVVKVEEKLGVAVMGRSQFKALVDCAVRLMDGQLPSGGRKILVHGPAGFGKTHLILQLVIYLAAAWEGKARRVAPILDCGYFREKRVEAMKQALAWAYAGNDDMIEEIASLNSMEDLEDFLSTKEEELLWCLDQYQDLFADPGAKQVVDASLRFFRKVVVTSAGGEEHTKENETLHKEAYMFPVHDGLTQEEQKLYDLIYGTECSTAAVKRLVREKLGGVAGCLADWHEAYYQRRVGEYLVHSVFGASPRFEVGRLEPVKGGELPGSVGKGNARGGALGTKAEDERRTAGVNPFRQAAGPEADEGAEASSADAGGGGAIRSEESRKEEGAESERTGEKAKYDWAAWERLLECERVVQISRSLERIYEKVKAKGGEKVEKWICQMKKMVYNESFVGFDLTDWDEIDLQNVAVEGGRVRPAFPLVREAIAHFVEQVQGRAVFYSDVAVWATLRSELEGERVPAVAGLLAERCAIGAIVDGAGYKAVLQDSKEEQVKLVFFERGAEAPAVLTETNDFQRSGLGARIVCFVPRTPFYPAMDMAILVLKRRGQELGSLIFEQLRDYLHRVFDELLDTASLGHLCDGCGRVR